MSKLHDFKVPTSFILGNKVYRVFEIGSLKGGRLGLMCTILKKMWIARGPRVVVPVSETFWHEVTHAVLHDMHHPLWADEKFVTEFSERLNQVITTAKFKEHDGPT